MSSRLVYANRCLPLRGLAALAIFAVGVGSVAGQESKPVAPKLEKETAWYNVADWGVEGKGWADTKHFYDRFPAKAEGVVPAPVWNLSRQSAGMAARFQSNATKISIRYTLLKKELAMYHMPATGVSGVDLYARNDQGQWRWLGVTHPESQTVETCVANGLDGKPRDYLLYLPLYNGVESLEIGLPSEASFEPLPPRKAKPLVLYGTSILQGGCASRPGMAWTAILGRRLDRPVINLGFSGKGRMEPEVGQLLAELDPVAYVIDCLPNLDGPSVAERAEPLVRQLRQAHPETPIVLVEDRTYSAAPFKAASREHHAASRAALKATYDKLVAEGMRGLVYVPGDSLLGDDDEATVDGSHPSDLGMLRQADALTPVLRPLVEGRE